MTASLRFGGQWSFRKDDMATSVKVEGRLMARASEGAIAAAVAGLGIVMAPLGACRREVERGELTNSAVAGMGRRIGRTQSGLCQRQGSKAVGTRICRLLNLN
jgi:DNA-binding transcriptional LysR family regulator